ncbi:MAG: hypothetical protein IAI48_18440, partial [Candidatus Eremiobacteraeota bacterium]|nr:hypothetical protein [Candidatus Eremiobacteraeota bacterium]
MRAIVALAIFAAGSIVGARADDDNAPVMPAGTHVHFHVDAPISSSNSKTGDTFAFVLLAPIVLVDRTIPVEATTGSGTVFLAGHAGSQGHEGDLTLRLDSLHTADGRTFTFDDQRFEIDGRNRKIVSGVLGLIPYAGIGARFIRGSDVRVDPSTPIETV